MVIAAPTNYDSVKYYFDTYCIEDVIDLIPCVSCFNEFDKYTEVKGLDSCAIIEGIGLDPRIGTH